MAISIEDALAEIGAFIDWPPVEFDGQRLDCLD
jgi:hypothetical protein